MSICTRVVVAVTFQKVDCAPNGKARAEGNHEGLKDANCAVKKAHNVTSNFIFRMKMPPIMAAKAKKCSVVSWKIMAYYKNDLMLKSN